MPPGLKFCNTVISLVAIIVHIQSYISKKRIWTCFNFFQRNTVFQFTAKLISKQSRGIEDLGTFPIKLDFLKSHIHIFFSYCMDEYLHSMGMFYRLVEINSFNFVVTLYTIVLFFHQNKVFRFFGCGNININYAYPTVPITYTRIKNHIVYLLVFTGQKQFQFVRKVIFSFIYGTVSGPFCIPRSNK